ncbi:MoaD/ThiS family protein [Paenibacillus algorifonticola]|uniref:MoaD/ThiS family protein n=1 Tax=Paenibacillus algorifonticola TaxID=684063 RepID=UPI003D2AFA9F
MKINTCYYATFREKTKKSDEVIETSAKNIRELYEELTRKYNFELTLNEILVSVNNENQFDFDYIVKDNDTIVFLHAMSGG